MITWILVADSGSARIFSRADASPTLEPVRNIQDVRGRARSGDLVSDRPGRIRSRSLRLSVSALGPHTDATEVEHQHFVRRLVHLLAHGHDVGMCQKLILVAPPHFLGLLRKALPPALARHVVASLDRDLTRVDPAAVLKAVNAIPVAAAIA